MCCGWERVGGRFTFYYKSPLCVERERTDSLSLIITYLSALLMSLPTIEFSNNYCSGYRAVSIRLADLVEDRCVMPWYVQNGRSVLTISAMEASSRIFLADMLSRNVATIDRIFFNTRAVPCRM